MKYLICIFLLTFKLSFSQSLYPEAEIDKVVTHFMTTHKVVGLQIAITKNEKIVFQKSYGYADKENKIAVNNNHLFRIASLSKTITAVGIYKLIEQGKLKLEDQVFGQNGVLQNDFGTPKKVLETITIQQLLQHTTGLWTNDNNDPMFRNNALNINDLIRDEITKNASSIKKVPNVYAYSNFGYAILGRVIEKISGKSYEKYIQDAILKPIRLHSIKLAQKNELGTWQDEVKYYSDAFNPYNMNVNRMDAHGGWIASATDYVKLMAYMDGFGHTEDVLLPETIQKMTTPSAQNQNYASGWAVNSNNNWWHTGSLPGTVSEMIRGSNGFNWVVLCNSSSESPNIFSDLDNLLWPIINNSDINWKTKIFMENIRRRR
ncbi:hypothetical protein B0A58_13755 [Flavobacterium branchiophilum NBRC 15030 = ATCC 35035]|uniref:CubicO group peptidase (Beta-lactamase class C family) n=1 Tax=Flavobacterium branchiophilum TaxID=55197 RepID=A0A543G575_9FLAO|nr:serine hydrolase domain-containing protein [Flavobacterium branchiophilum]OXA71345.1 hypothetical protein B0A58_13755 [Flavobacterium branchiophilum NBRC 15030 = ATCC 35035]TQM41195.1 CubicO group peptidase (beta-lactamase class C family) [Flavobacterium branchiophilum]GEM56466.1 penicillin-binding protein [Flavobacterium branchiophilum NBRC 15030 = ATCC 35035]